MNASFIHLYRIKVPKPQFTTSIVKKGKTGLRRGGSAEGRGGGGGGVW